ncbi:MAG: hypothetical protein RIS70_4398 [Planctomycetota bacterium]
MIARRRVKTQRAAFSLLELLIVLVVMVGLMAIAWPSLRRPLADSVLQQAGNEMRQAMETARQTSLATGRPVLLRVSAESADLQLRSLQHLIGAERRDNQDLATSQRSGTQPETSLEKRATFSDSPALPAIPSLSAGVIIETVILGDAVPDADTWERDQDRIGGRPSGSGIRTDEPSSWLIPFLPSGRSIDCTIVLRDTSNQRRLGVRRESATGSLRFTAMPSRRNERDRP